MLNFLTENWKLIAIIGAILVELVIILVFKKRPEVIDNSFLIRLCLWIEEAEKKFVAGTDKLDYVLSAAKNYLGEKFSEKDVRNMIEYVLTLPEKKGVKHEK